MSYKVSLIEYERGWGSQVDEIKSFESLDEAQEFVEKFNSKNTSDVVPDWYMIALAPVWSK